MPRRSSIDPPGSTFQSRGFAGGVNLRDAVNLLSLSELRKSENGVLDERGGWSKRLGCLNMGTFGAGTDRVLSAYTFYRGDSAPQVLIHTSGGKIYYTNDPTTNPITWTQIATGLSTTAPFSFETFNGKCYFSNGVDSYASWDGTTYTTFASAPKGKYLRLWKDTMWVAGVSGLPDRLYSSDPGDAETFGVSSWVDIAKGDGDQVTCLATDGLFLSFGKRNRGFLVYDPVTFANRTVDFEKGFESHFGTIQFEGEIYFISRRGICRWYNDSPARIISGKIDPLFDPGILNLNALNVAYAYTYDNRVGWAVCEVGSSVPTLQIEYYPRLADQYGVGPFSFHRMPVGSFARYRHNTVDRLFGGSTTANKVYQVFGAVGQDDGVTFSSLMETGPIDFGAPTHVKYLRRLRVLGRGKFTLSLIRNFQTALYKTFAIDLTSSSDVWTVTDTWGSGTWGPDSLIKEQRLHPDAYARFFIVRITDVETDLGKKPVPVGSLDYSLDAGRWGLYGLYYDASVMGVRD